MPEEKQLLTHSRISAFKECRRKHWYLYEQAIRPIADAKALRMGSAYHDGLEALANGRPIDDACEIVRQRYQTVEFDDVLYEQETVLRLLCGYLWRWQDSWPEHIAAEQEFELPLINPETGKATPLFSLAGKIDGIVKLEDGRLAVMEHKLLSEDLSSDSALWRRLRIDHQISLYVLAARRLGYPVDTVLYNVARKPTIEPTAVPVLDSLGVKIVLDRSGERVKTEKGLWRQTGDSAKGYTLQTRPMTVDEWGEKLAADIAVRPEFYYARIEVPRLDQDLQEFEYELWDIQQSLRDAQRNGRHYRTCTKNTCAWCPLFEPCSASIDVTQTVPDGFVRLENPHQELKGRTNGNCITAETTTCAAPF